MMLGRPICCPVCGIEDKAKAIERAGAYDMQLCLQCDVVFADPMRHLGREWYEQTYQCASSFGEQAVDILGGSAKWLLRGAHHNPFVRDRPGAGSRLLDIGCGDGHFLGWAKNFYAATTGAEIRKQAVDKARARYNLSDVHLATLEQFYRKWLVSGRERFGVITLFDVLEHLEDPVTSIDMVRQMLEPGGTLAITLPNRDRWPDFYRHADSPPNHLTRWNRRALSRFLRASGLDVTKLEDFNESGYVTLRYTEAPLGTLSLLFPGLGSSQGFQTSAVASGRHSAASYLMAWAWRIRLEAAHITDSLFFAALALLGAPRQNLYCLAQRPKS